MTRLSLSTENLSHGLNATHTAIVAADGAQFDYDASVFLHVVNTDDTDPITFTIRTNFTNDGLALPDRTFSVPALAERFTKFLKRDVYKQSNDKVYIDASADGLEVAVLKAL